MASKKTAAKASSVAPGPITQAEYEAFLERTGEQPFDYDESKDGEITYTVESNGDLLVQCATSMRFRKYPYDIEVSE